MGLATAVAVTGPSYAAGSVAASADFTQVRLDDGVTVTIVTDSLGNFVGADALLYDGTAIISSSTAETQVQLLKDGTVLVPLGGLSIALCHDDTTDQWSDCGIFGANANTPLGCNVAAAPIGPGKFVVVFQCGGGRDVTVCIFCQNAQGQWTHQCSVINSV